MEEKEKEQKEEKETEEKKDDTAQIVATIKAEYETKLAEQASAYEEKIRKRDDVIKQLVSGNGTEESTSNTPIADAINEAVARRNKF